jgi:hypothetical protein
MNLGGVEFPQNIIDAIDTHKLVVFAGAGVSMGEPSCLPSFWKLANDLAAGTGLSPKELGRDGDGEKIYEPLDQFLGRLPVNHSSLREKAADLTDLDNPHNELHESLVRLYGESSNVRVVTTNYDLMFESAADSLWKVAPEIYSAPALPVGTNFRGLVHVHGAVSRPFGIVLTDGDFGRAYLTEGWARRFLVDVFSGNNIILFVGYSYEDTVLHYLARALPDRSEKSRYALVGPDDNEDKWRLLGIEPVVFSKADQNDYSALYLASKELADYATRKPSEWQEKIGRIAENSPETADIEDEDLIRSALMNESRIRFFAQKAEDVKWIPWLIREGAFVPLFEADNPKKHTIELSNWLIKEFLHKSPDHVIQVFASDQRPVKQWFWWQLALEARAIEDPTTFGRFFDYLLQAKPWNADFHALQFLGKQCAKLGDVDRLLLVFKEMAKAHISLNKPYSIDDEHYPYRHEIETVSPHWNLEETWKLLASHFDTHGEAILHICEETFLIRKIAGDSWWRIGIHWDFDSDRRSSIEYHEQDNYPQAIDVVIDAAREVLAYLGKNAPDYAEHWVHSRSTSSSHLIRRLAIYAIGQLVTLDSGERIRLLLAKGVFNDIHRQESFMLLNQEFPEADAKAKALAINEVLSYQDDSEENGEKITAQVHLDWLSALQESDPECAEVQTALDEVLSKFPGLEAKKYPGLDSWMQAGHRTPESPYSVTALLAEDGPGFEMILGFDSEPFPFSRGPSKSGLEAAVRDAADRDPDWGFKFLYYLMEAADWDSKYLSGLLRAVGKWPDNLDSAEHLLEVLQKDEIQNRNPHLVADIVLESVRSGGLPYICEILNRTNEIAASIMNLIEASPSPVSGDNVDWHLKSINTTEGRIAEYWIHALSVQINKCGDRVFEEPYKSAIAQLVDTSEEASKYTIPAVTQQIAFLHGVDENWLLEHVVPLFVASNEATQAQAWDGYLTSNGPRKATFELLEGAFENALSRLDKLFCERQQNRFIEFLTASIVWFVEKPNAVWIPRLITALNARGRLAFAHDMTHFLCKLQDEDRNVAWDSWIGDYWLRRKEGAPVELNNNEINAMINWLPNLGDRFPEGVDIAVTVPCERLEKHSPVHELGKSGLVERFPNDMARLVIYFLRHDSGHFYLYDLEDKILNPLADQQIDESVKQALNEALIQAGRTPLNPH